MLPGDVLNCALVGNAAGEMDLISPEAWPEMRGDNLESTN
jgi:hypothetical protein